MFAISITLHPQLESLLSSPTFWFQASRNGATGVQLDLSFTADGVPVLMHDETLDRTTNGSGPVNKIAFVQLRRLDAGLRHRMRYAKQEYAKLSG